MNKTMLLLAAGIMGIATACNHEPEKKDNESGVEIEGKKGGGLDIDKDGMKIEGRKGGELDVDSNGVEIEKRDK